MKSLLIMLLLLISTALQAQDGFILTKEQHDQIRKNIADYKILIKDYNVQSKQLDSVKKAFALYKKLHSIQNNEIEEMKLKVQELRIENNRLNNTEYDNTRLKEELESTKRTVEIRTREMFFYKRKYERELKLTRGDRIFGNAVLGTFVACALWTIYISYEQNYGF
jgi:hypothetical protein